MPPNTASTKTVAQKLRLKAGQHIALINAPEGALALFGDLPEGVSLAAQAKGPAEIVLLFANSHAELEQMLPEARAALAPGGALWVAYHKGTSVVKTDINRDIIWRYARAQGMDAVSMIAVDEDWSAMRLKITPEGGA